jgi:hypothetical protein
LVCALLATLVRLRRNHLTCLVCALLATPVRLWRNHLTCRSVLTLPNVLTHQKDANNKVQY